MKVLIIEDEQPSAVRLQNMLEDLEEDIQVMGITSGISSSLELLSKEKNIDLLFLDLHLSDGMGTDILQNLDREIPIIITTAYDQYALDAYKYLSVDYLLKPIKIQELKNAIHKYKSNYKRKKDQIPIDDLRSLLLNDTFKSTLICRRGNNRYPIKVTDIAYIYIEDRETWIILHSGKELYISKTLDQVEEELDSGVFFRANRKIICSKASVDKFEILAKSRIKVHLVPSPTFEVIISSNKSLTFKEWVQR